jgi:hypothetical protein
VIEGRAPGERRIGVLGIAAAMAVFGILLLVVPPYFVTFDEAKYLGIGASLWAGRGPETAFGYEFLSHSPLWSALVYAPQALIGMSALDWGHAINAASGIAVVGIAGLIGWRIRPAAGAIAAASLVGIFYLHDLSRTARLDIPAAALALAYVWIGLRSVDRGSVRLAAVAGFVFAIGFLIKEITLPFAPVPLIAGILAGRPASVLSRTAAATLATAALGVSWWFALYAADAGRVYRLDAPVWTLVPIGIGFLIAIVVGFAGPRYAERPRFVALRARISSARPWLTRRSRALVGWGSLAAWFGLQLLVFGRTARLKGAPLLDIDQFALYADQWLVGPLGLAAAVGIAGFALAIGARRAARGTAARHGIDDAIVASIAGLPLILLVIGVGEPPRNYLAQIGVAGALSAAGWLWAAEHIAIRVASAVRSSPATARGVVVAGIAVAALIGGTGILGIHVRANATTPGGLARSEAVETAVGWLRANVAPGTTIAFGSFLSYEMAYDLTADYRTVQVRHRISIVDPSTPLGLLRVKEPPADDWIAVDTAPRNVREFQAYRAAWLTRSLTNAGVGYWVYSTGVPTSAPTILAQLTPDHGFERVAGWSFPVAGAPPIEVAVFRVDLGSLAFDTSKLYAAPDALDRMVTLLEEHPEEGRGVATRLAGRVVVVPDGPAAAAAFARLQALAAN